MPCSAAPGRYPDVDRQNIVGDGRPAGEQHTLGAAIYSDRLRMDETGSGHGRQPDEIDVRLFRRIEARNNAGQHARIGCLQVAGDERHPHAPQWALREGLDNMHMGVAAAEQQDVG